MPNGKGFAKPWFGPSNEEIEGKVAEATSSILRQVVGALADIGVDLGTPATAAKGNLAKKEASARDGREKAVTTRVKAEDDYQAAVKAAEDTKNREMLVANKYFYEAEEQQAAANRLKSALALLGLDKVEEKTS